VGGGAKVVVIGEMKLCFSVSLSTGEVVAAVQSLRAGLGWAAMIGRDGVRNSVMNRWTSRDAETVVATRPG